MRCQTCPRCGGCWAHSGGCDNDPCHCEEDQWDRADYELDQLSMRELETYEEDYIR